MIKNSNSIYEIQKQIHIYHYLGSGKKLKKNVQKNENEKLRFH